jgi:hypothetical protein
LGDDSSSEMSLELSEECRQRNAAVAASLRPVQDHNDDVIKLSHQVLALFAGMHGPKSKVAADEILLRVDPLNWAADRHNARRVQLQELKEGWFLERPLMHLAVSNVLVWGPDASQRPNGVLPGDQRLYLLQKLLEFATASSSAAGRSAAVRQLLQSTNRNKATPFFTACFFCFPEVLTFLLGLRELGWRQMLQATKRGKLLLL